jgi:hypothetical protein
MRMIACPPLARAAVCQRRGREGGACVVQRRVQMAVGVERPLDEVLDCGRLADAGGDGQHLATQGADLLGRMARRESGSRVAARREKALQRVG